MKQIIKTNSKFSENELTKHVLPPVPFLGFKNEVHIEKADIPLDVNVWRATPPTPKDKQYFSLSFKKENEKQSYTLPYEPFVDIAGGNTIIKRTVAKQPKKAKGTIKEHWNTKDYEITIRGVLIGSLLTGSVKECYPIDDFNKLKEYFECGESIKVYCEPLNLLNILEVVIESISYPFTKGENVQAYEIKAYSNTLPKLLIEIIDEQLIN